MAERCGPGACALVICAALAASPAAGQERCSPAVEAELTELGIARGRVADMVFGRETTSGEGAELIAIRAWITLKDCDGALVIQMRPDCRFVQAYTTKSCKIAGLYHSC
jgi:hypothetical protein